jgi:hypothetical protein
MRVEVREYYRKLHNEELRNLHSSANTWMTKSRKIKMGLAGHVAHRTWVRNMHKILFRKPEGERKLGRPRHRWEDNIRMDVREIHWEVWIGFICLKTGTGGELLRRW